MNIRVQEGERKDELPLEELIARQAPDAFSIGERVPGVTGKAFDLLAWYRSWSRSEKAASGSLPTHLRVEAADEFQATIHMSELGSAAILYEQNGRPLEKGFPLRLYVPNGSSECLNVKSVVSVQWLDDPEGENKSAFGFKNQLSADDLKRGFR